MRHTLAVLAAVLAFTAFSADAATKQCRDASGKFIACPPAAATGTAANTSAKTGTSTATSTGGAPHCKTGKPCGNSCIAQNKECHK
jgi:hypothetical protein